MNTGGMNTGMRAWLLAIAALGGAACGDNRLPDGASLAPSAELAIVAHQGDDLVFLQPDLADAALRATGLTVVYVTAGSGERGTEIAQAQAGGALAAWGALAGGSDWACGWNELAGHAAEHCRLEAAGISLVFLGYPDGGVDGRAPDSLLHLWQGDVATATTVGPRTARYDRPGLIAALAQIIDTTAPATLRTLEIASNHGRDHSDHMLVGALAVLATAASPRSPQLISYRGYNVEDEPANAAPGLSDRSFDALAHFDACTTGCAPCGRACPADKLDPDQIRWLARRYAVGMRRSAAGQLRIGNGCASATATGGNAAIIDCAGAPTWELDDRGALRSTTGLCLDVILTGEVVAGPCDASSAGGRFFLDDDGELWSGAPPPARDGLALQHLYCVGQAGGRPRAGLCGAQTAPAWEVSRPTTATPRATAAITRTGRAVRLARFAGDARPRLCAIEAGGLLCAAGLPGGGLAPAVLLDSPAAPLAIEPESLVLGDVDGDGATDACGRDAGGILCATAAAGYQATRWATVLGSAGPATPTDRSLAIVPGGQICGLAAAGVVCVARGATSITDIRSTWPDRGAALWLADLDADHAADWCAATSAGPACSLARHRALTTSGLAWGYASGGRVDNSASDGALPDTATAAFTDIDGDGRDDLCTVQDDLIACAPSLGDSFGPRAPVARLPPGMIPTGLWAEPALPGQPPRLCAGDATTIACTDESPRPTVRHR
jgi:LmbE family N-acetylglucosaminyl deacetylase